MQAGGTSWLETPIEFLKGVGPDRAALLRKELEIDTFGDLLRHYPYRYIDRSQVQQIAQLQPGDSYIQLRGILGPVTEIAEGRRKRLTALFRDNTGAIELVWFNGIRWLKDSLQPGKEMLLFGKLNVFNNRFSIIHPELDPVEKFAGREHAGFQPLYHTTEKMKAKGLDSRGVFKLTGNLLAQLQPLHLPENLPPFVLETYRLPGRYTATRYIHQPEDMAQQQQALRRLKFEELFMTQMNIIRLKVMRKKESGWLFETVGTHFNTFYENHLPFQLTGAQKRVLKEIRSDTLTGRQMNRLIQGDVGSGKTIVALLAMLLALDNTRHDDGAPFQACLMAPTEILAQQHYNSLSELLQPAGIEIALLTGNVKGKARKEILAGAADGSIPLLVGTHALIEDTVQFRNLGLVVIDEQHRFGVEQRAKLWKKNSTAPHILVMTATPIPRTLALTLYGDLDVSVIDELPPGRKPIKTLHFYESARLRVFGFIKEEIAKGRQVYIVYPLIEESEKLDLTSLMEGYEAICRSFPLPDYRVSIVHGKMPAETKDFEMMRFVKGETHIMVATTVIEVGVNVPNASVMIIEHAERFGLSQLHQLRGRVGRGAEQSFCLLLTGQPLNPTAKRRIQTMVDTNDGFKIAEVDLELRGPGDIEGTRQSGDMGLKVANIMSDQRILEEARKAAEKILDEDPGLKLPEHYGLRVYLLSQPATKSYWAQIS